MASKKIKRKSLARKIAPVRTIKSRYISFFVGVVTVVAIAFAIFQYAQSNNYKTVLGEKTPNIEQSR